VQFSAPFLIIVDLLLDVCIYAFATKATISAQTEAVGCASASEQRFSVLTEGNSPTSIKKHRFTRGGVFLVDIICSL
jgi:hypothetical protein